MKGSLSRKMEKSVFSKVAPKLFSYHLLFCNETALNLISSWCLFLYPWTWAESLTALTNRIGWKWYHPVICKDFPWPSSFNSHSYDIGGLPWDHHAWCVSIWYFWSTWRGPRRGPWVEASGFSRAGAKFKEMLSLRCTCTRLRVSTSLTFAHWQSHS